MNVFTIGGQAGAGAPEVGIRVARALGARYVEHLALRRLARNLGATAEAVTRKELAFCSRKDRFIQALEYLFSRIGWYGVDPSLGAMPPIELYEELDGVKRLPGEISATDYVDALHETARQFADEGNQVLVKRAGCVTLRDFPEIIHIGLFAPERLRVARIARRLSLGVGEAEDVLSGLERARAAWFAKIADADPMDRDLYSINLTLDDEASISGAVDAIVNEVFSTQPIILSDGYEEPVRI